MKRRHLLATLLGALACLSDAGSPRARAGHALVPPPFKLTRALEHHELQFARDYASMHNGRLPDDPFWSYLHYRHDLAPQRFDHYHPLIGRMIERDELVRLSPPRPTPPWGDVPIRPPVSKADDFPSTWASPRPPIAVVPIRPPVSKADDFPSTWASPQPPIAVPEPTSALLLGLGVAVVLTWCRARRKPRHFGGGG